MEKKLIHCLPSEIEKKSFEIIQSELSVSLNPETTPIVLRCIHTTADFEYAKNLVFSKGVVEEAITAIRNGADIITDTNMAKAGINQRILNQYGGNVHCFMADSEVAKEAKRRGVTRAIISMEQTTRFTKPFIVAIGNAPTALIRVYELIQEGLIQPKAVIGVPVGFVNVVEAKELIMTTKIPYIVAKGRKGGSNVAAAICNALLYMMQRE